LGPGQGKEREGGTVPERWVRNPWPTDGLASRCAGNEPHGATKEDVMCLTCGCGDLNDDHGDSRHITYDDLKAAAQAAKVSVDEAVKNFDETVKKAS
jgi:hypothetical protein